MNNISKTSPLGSRLEAGAGKALAQTFKTSTTRGKHGLKELVAQHKWGERSYVRLVAWQNLNTFAIEMKRIDECAQHRTKYFLSEALEHVSSELRDPFLKKCDIHHGSGNLLWSFSLKMSSDFNDVRNFSFCEGWAAVSRPLFSFSGLNREEFLNRYYADPLASIIIDRFWQQNISMLETAGTAGSTPITEKQGRLLRLFLLKKIDR
jgi:hypothetical protein